MAILKNCLLQILSQKCYCVGRYFLNPFSNFKTCLSVGVPWGVSLQGQESSLKSMSFPELYFSLPSPREREGNEVAFENMYNSNRSELLMCKKSQALFVLWSLIILTSFILLTYHVP